MSFTATVKNEVIKLELTELQKVSLLSAIVKNNNEQKEKLQIKIENINVAREVYSLIKEITRITPKVTIRNGYNYRKKMLYIIEVNNLEHSKQILNSLGITNDQIPSDFIYADEELIRSYLSGVFLSCGSINDPKTSRYHLEFVVNNNEYAIFISKLLNTFYLNSKVLKRENKYMIYIKEAEKISDFLRIMNAVNSLLYYEDIRIYRDNVNMTNRLNNCEQANIDKIIETGFKQVENINLIKNEASLDLLDEKTRVAATYRLKYPETSLTELSEIISIETSNKITKSGLHHRLKKIEDLANKIRNTNN